MYIRCDLHETISFLDSLAVALFEGFPPIVQCKLRNQYIH